MKQSRTPISHSQVNILKYDQNFQNVGIKVTKTVATLNTDGVLVAGTIVNSVGATVNDATAYGIVYTDKDFTNSTGTEVVPVTIFGFVDSKVLPVAPSAATITALNLIKFL